MHAYHRMEADQTDSIAVCATREEWREYMSSVGEIDPWLDQNAPAWWLERAIEEAGIDL